MLLTPSSRANQTSHRESKGEKGDRATIAADPAVAEPRGHSRWGLAGGPRTIPSTFKVWVWFPGVGESTKPL
jgi:hypothetical protein